MEKLGVPPSVQEKTLRDLFVRPYGRLTIQRPLRHFGKALGLTPGMPKEPDDEFLTKLITGHRTHQALFRTILGGQYRNFENLVRGRAKASKGTQVLLARRLNSSPEELMGLVHGEPEGPLLPDYLELLKGGEGFFSWWYAKLTEGFVPCPCCGENLLGDDATVWWPKATNGHMREPECLFADRLLSAIMGWRLFRRFLGKITGGRDGDFAGLSLKCEGPVHYPVGNWLQIVRQAHGCSDSLELEKWFALLPEERRPLRHVTQPRLNKWACGEDLIPLDLGRSLVKGLDNASELEFVLIEARALAFIQEFISAAMLGNTPPEQNEVRQVVYARMEALQHKLNVSFARFEQKTPRSLAPITT